jgi:16S rRNA (guanine966-N2)-methyltransferase
MSLRIISGLRRGALIETPEGMETRPLRDRIRESLFNMLRPELVGAVVLDAFAGSGAVGMEALSNRASQALFCEQSPKASAVITQNLRKLRFDAQGTLLQGTVPAILSEIPKHANRLDFIFLMPPYHSNLCLAVLAAQPIQTLAVPGQTTAICEVHRDEPIPEHPAWKETDRREYGITRLLRLEFLGA